METIKDVNMRHVGRASARHLLGLVPGALGRAMRHINGVYTQRFNRINKTDGPLFRGRYKAIIVDSDEYLLHLSKYIHLNPIKANIVEKPDDYPWSSYLVYVGKKFEDDFIVCNEIYGQLSGCANKQKGYYHFMSDAFINEDIQKFYTKHHSSAILAKKEFTSKIKPTQSKEVSKKHYHPFTVSLDDIILATSKFYNVDVSDVICIKRGRQPLNEPRKVAMYIAHQFTFLTVNEVAKFFSLSHYGGLTAAKHCVSEKIKMNPCFRSNVDALLKILDLK